MRNIPKIEGVNDTLASVLKALTIGTATLSVITIGNTSNLDQYLNIVKPKTKIVTGNLLALGNPTVALMRLFYSHQRYNFPIDVTSETTVFEEYKMGRYSWIYLITPFISAVMAALLARSHIKELTNRFNKQ